MTAYKRIEWTVNLCVAKPLTWLLYLTWLAVCWCATQASRFRIWLRQRCGKSKGSAKTPSAALSGR